MKYVLDPLLFALDEKATQNSFECFIQQLITLEKWQKNNPGKFFVLSDIMGLLAENDFYPFDNRVKAFIQKYGISYIQAADVSRIMGKIIDKSRQLDQLCSDRFVDYLGFEIVDPENYRFVNRSQPFLDSIGKMIWYVSLYSDEKKCSDKSFSFFFKGISNVFRVDLRYNELIDDDIEECSRSLAISCHESVCDLLNDVNTPFLLWSNAEDTNDMEWGIKSALAQKDGVSDCMDLDQFDFCIQHSFFEDMSSHHYMDEVVVVNEGIHAIVNTILGVDKRKAHPIRENEGGNSPDLKVGRFKAFRRELPSGGRRIHYWKSGQTFCFANIDEHKEMRISDCVVK